MPRFAQILFDTDPESGEPLVSGTVANLPEASEEIAADLGWIACGDEVAIGWRWDGEAFAAPVVEIATRKAALRDTVNAYKRAMQNGVAPTPVGPVDCDTDSRNKLNGAVLMAMLAAQAGQPFAIEWTLADNSNAPLNGPGMIAMASAVGTYVAACHAHAQALKAAIAAAPDHAALDAIDLLAGWP